MLEEKLNKYEKFLSELKLNSELFRVKTVEADIPLVTSELDDLFFNQDTWMEFEDFFNHYLQKYEKELKEKFRKEPVCKVLAIDSPFSKKEDLKSRKYRWDPYNKYWWKNILTKDIDREKEWLTNNIYFGNFKGLFEENNWEKFLKGLRARLYRTQFGFLTEYHAYFLAKTIFGDKEVKRDPVSDARGVDFKILRNKNIYNIHIFVDTPRAWYYRKIKSKYRKADQEEGIHINFPYSLKQGQNNSLRFLANGFGVYQKSYFEYLKKQIDNGYYNNN